MQTRDMAIRVPLYLAACCALCVIPLIIVVIVAGQKIRGPDTLVYTTQVPPFDASTRVSSHDFAMQFSGTLRGCFRYISPIYELII